MPSRVVHLEAKGGLKADVGRLIGERHAGALQG